MTRRVLSQRRASETFDLRFWNQKFTVSVGHYPDGTIGEVFIDVAKSGQDIQSIARDAAVVISLAAPPRATALRVDIKNVDFSTSAGFNIAALVVVAILAVLYGVWW